MNTQRDARNRKITGEALFEDNPSIITINMRSEENDRGERTAQRAAGRRDVRKSTCLRSVGVQINYRQNRACGVKKKKRFCYRTV